MANSVKPIVYIKNFIGLGEGLLPIKEFSSPTDAIASVYKTIWIRRDNASSPLVQIFLMGLISGYLSYGVSNATAALFRDLAIIFLISHEASGPPTVSKDNEQIRIWPLDAKQVIAARSKFATNLIWLYVIGSFGGMALNKSQTLFSDALQAICIGLVSIFLAAWLSTNPNIRKIAIKLSIASFVGWQLKNSVQKILFSFFGPFSGFDLLAIGTILSPILAFIFYYLALRSQRLDFSLPKLRRKISIPCVGGWKYPSLSWVSAVFEERVGLASLFFFIVLVLSAQEMEIFRFSLKNTLLLKMPKQSLFMSANTALVLAAATSTGLACYFVSLIIGRRLFPRADQARSNQEKSEMYRLPISPANMFLAIAILLGGINIVIVILSMTTWAVSYGTVALVASLAGGLIWVFATPLINVMSIVRANSSSTVTIRSFLSSFILLPFEVMSIIVILIGYSTSGIAGLVGFGCIFGLFSGAIGLLFGGSILARFISPKNVTI